jgi:oligopeptide/dipeptide ABC transporter ATP-binding protein
VDFRSGTGESLDFRDNSFDLVFFGYSLHHQDSLAALSEAQRVLAPMGEILIIEPTVRSEYTRLVSVFEKDEPVLLRRAEQDIASFGNAILKHSCRRYHPMTLNCPCMQPVFLKGEQPNPARPPSGSTFHPRCRYADTERCIMEAPRFREVSAGHFIACHHAESLHLKGALEH